jgi:hypothetical protein
VEKKRREKAQNDARPEARMQNVVAYPLKGVRRCGVCNQDDAVVLNVRIFLELKLLARLQGNGPTFVVFGGVHGG